MGSYPSAVMNIDLTVNATNFEDSVHYSTTVGTFASDCNQIASSLWAYLYSVQGGTLATPSTTISFIPGLIRIQDVTAPRTPYGYSTSYVNGEAVATAIENQHFRYSFHLGPNDFSSQPTLATALANACQAAQAFTPNY